jgi:type II restriction/modification system DNA methylase subunit YeeA
LEAFQRKVAATTVLDPACGSGNFLYVSLQLLLGLEKEVLAYATQLGFTLRPQVSVQQLRALEINPYAYELAQVSVQIGFLQWRRDNGFDNDRSPVLQNLEGFENKDALLREVFKRQPKDLKEAQAEEHAPDASTKGYVEREWPACEVIVGNPPFLGTKKLRSELGDDYVEELFHVYGNRIPNFSDLCCYWFEKARDQIGKGKCKRAGLLATQGIRGGRNRDVLQRIVETGDIFFAESDRPWVLDGASVHVSMVGFDDGSQKERILDGKSVPKINTNLTATTDTTKAIPLKQNAGIAFIADVKGGSFEIVDSVAQRMLENPNPHGRPNSDVLLPWVNSLDVLRRPRAIWIVDFGCDSGEQEASSYEQPFAQVLNHVRPHRMNVSNPRERDKWWIHSRPCGSMREAIAPFPRFIVTTTVSKHRVFAWQESPTLPDHQLVAFSRADDSFLGILQSRFHEVWALKQGTRLETRPRYTPTTSFETFPLPTATGKQEAAIAAATKELNELRERWLNPPEWTETRTLEFPGSVSGPWARYVDPATVNAKTGVGTVRYPRLEPKDAEHAAKLKKRTLTNLYNERPAWLANAHKTLDAAVAAAYGFPTDLTDEQILERLLALNLDRAAEEAKSAQTTKPAKKTQREKSADEFV